MSGTATTTPAASFYPYAPRCPLGRRAFTLTEMMVSVVVMIILLGITALVYKAANDAMHLNNASVMVIDDFNALTTQIDLTMENVYTDGYLVIYGYDVRNQTNKIAEKKPDGKVVFDKDVLPSVRSDAICFFTTGNFKSLTNPAIAANSGWVYLGHSGSVNPETYGSSPFDTATTANPLVPNRWVLSKYLLLFTPGYIGQYGDDYRIASIGWYIQDISSDTNKLANKTDLQIRNWFYSNWINDRGEFPGDNFWFTPPAINFDDVDFAGIPAGLTFPYTLPNTGSFKVEFAMPKSYFNVNDPNDEPEQFTDTKKTIVWRSAIDRRPYNPNDLTEQAVVFPGAFPAIPNPVNADDLNKRSNDAIAVFGPNDVWPLFIKFTIRKYDDDLTITSDERFIIGNSDKTHTHGGRTLEYVYKLPVKQ